MTRCGNAFCGGDGLAGIAGAPSTAQEEVATYPISASSPCFSFTLHTCPQFQSYFDSSMLNSFA
jgi:hypothetical protein